MEGDYGSSLLNDGEDNNFTVVDKKEVADDANKVSSTSGTHGEDSGEDRYLEHNTPDVNTLIDFDDITSSAAPNDSNVTDPVDSPGETESHEADNDAIQPDWGPYNEKLGFLQTETKSSPTEVDNVLKEFAPDPPRTGTTTNKVETPTLTSSDPAPTPKPQTHDHNVGDTKCCSNWFSKVDPRSGHENTEKALTSEELVGAVGGNQPASGDTHQTTDNKDETIELSACIQDKDGTMNTVTVDAEAAIAAVGGDDIQSTVSEAIDDIVQNEDIGRIGPSAPVTQIGNNLPDVIVNNAKNLEKTKFCGVLAEVTAEIHNSLQLVDQHSAMLSPVPDDEDDFDIIPLHPARAVMSFGTIINDAVIEDVYVDETIGGAMENLLIMVPFSRLLDLIYWRDVKKTGAVFGAMMFVLLSITFCSFLSVVSYLSLGLLAVTLSYRAYKSVLQAVQKTDDQHPFKEYLDMDMAFTRETLDNAVAILEKRLNSTVKELLRLFLVEDIVDSVKFFLLLWVFTYVGSWFNGLTLVILAAIVAFSLPKVYELYQEPIDNYLDLARTQVNKLVTQVQDKVPFLKKKPKTQ